MSRSLAAIAGAVVLVACASTPRSEAVGTPPTGGSSSVTSVPSVSAVPAPTATKPILQQRSFTSSAQRLDRAVKRSMRGVSWRPGCPVGPRQLRLVTVSYHSFRGDTRVGRLVVHRDSAAKIVSVFRAMYRHGYPIRRMRLVEAYGGSDMRSITANNTSAFNCRAVPGSSTWSQHAYGRAVDINPVQNPYWRLASGYVEPRRGRKFLDRSRQHPAMIHEGDAVVRAFDRIGWGWGGRWSSVKDWQHFSATGR